MCGERGSSSSRASGAPGSSPRVRGTPRRPSHACLRLRFIPACAGNALSIVARPLQITVHPRVCGERLLEITPREWLDGSSPRVRGTLHRPMHSQGFCRFIPACAGNAHQPIRRNCLPTVHPRVCGERTQTPEILESYDGSSPRVRGTLMGALEKGKRPRFIPACAGNARYSAAVEKDETVHPRVCGERAASRPVNQSGTGSSPRVRGTHGAAHCRPSTNRFIPACAGNAIYKARAKQSMSVHPRVCGERYTTTVMTQRKPGSSPRVRGTLCVPAAMPDPPRFIPACAGNATPKRLRAALAAVHPRVCGERATISQHQIYGVGSSPRVRGTHSPDQRARVLGTVHPRVCGERRRAGAEKRSEVGSSPRVRGTHLRDRTVEARQRFIPACAGNAEWDNHAVVCQPVHPRVCGERACRHCSRRKLNGSSPRVRGTHLAMMAVRLIERFIPACAGNAVGRHVFAALHSVHPRVCGER